MDYTKYADKARTKIDQYGGEVTVIREGTTEYDPVTNTYTSNEVTFKGKGIVSSISSSLVNGTSVLAGDVMMMGYFTGVPQINDKVTIGGTERTVMNIDAVNPDGNCVIYYNLHLR